MEAEVNSKSSDELALLLHSMLVQLYELEARFLMIEEHPDSTKAIRFTAKRHYNILKSHLLPLSHEILQKFPTFEQEFNVAKASDTLSAVLEIVVLSDRKTKVDIINSATRHYCELIDRIVSEPEKAVLYKDFMVNKNQVFVDRLEGSFYDLDATKTK